MADVPDVPDECLNGNHDFDQGGRCKRCNIYRVNTSRSWEERRSGGAGSRLHALTNREYREQMKKLQR